MMFASSVFDTPLGQMLAIANEEALYLLEFTDESKLEKKRKDFKVRDGETYPIHSIKNELNLYFEGKLKTFSTPLTLLGTPFQKKVWLELKKIPYGKTLPYSSIAKTIEKPNASRAVGSANGANRLVIVIPCHRVVSASGLGGYSSGIQRKQWLLHHESKT